MRSAQNTMDTKVTTEWHPRRWWEGSSDYSMGEGLGRWARLPFTETKSHEDKAISYA